MFGLRDANWYRRAKFIAVPARWFKERRFFKFVRAKILSPRSPNTSHSDAPRRDINDAKIYWREVFIMFPRILSLVETTRLSPYLPFGRARRSRAGSLATYATRVSTCVYVVAFVHDDVSYELVVNHDGEWWHHLSRRAVNVRRPRWLSSNLCASYKRSICI